MEIILFWNHVRDFGYIYEGSSYEFSLQLLFFLPVALTHALEIILLRGFAELFTTTVT